MGPAARELWMTQGQRLAILRPSRRSWSLTLRATTFLSLWLVLGPLALAQPLAATTSEPICDQSDDCPASLDSKNGSRLCVQLRLQNGHIAAGNTTFACNRAFSELKPDPELRRRLTAILDEQLEALATPCDYTRSHQEISDENLPRAGQVSPDPCTFTGDWTTFTGAFIQWLPTAGLGLDTVTNVLNVSQLFRGLQTALNEQPLWLNVDPGEFEPFDLESGFMTFNVLDPVDSDKIEFEFPLLSDPGEREQRTKQIRKRVRPLDGQLWRTSRLLSRIGGFYDELGWIPSIEPSPLSSSFRIIQSRRVARILFPKPAAGIDSQESRASIEKIFYSLATDRDFRSFVRNRDRILAAMAARGENLNVLPFDYALDLGRPPLGQPLLNSRQLQIQQLALAQLGFVLVLATNTTCATGSSGLDPSQACVDLEVRETSQGKTKTSEAVTPAAPLADEAGQVRTGVQEAERETDFAPTAPVRDGGPPPAAGEDTVKDRKNYLGFGIQYSPGQGVRVFGLAQRSRLGVPFSDGSVSVRLGANGDGSLLSSLSYFADYVGFERLHRRISLQFNGASQTEASRVLAGSRLDEDRSGGMARVELEAFRDRDNTLLLFYGEGQRKTVTFSRDAEVSDKRNLSTLDLGARVLYEGLGREYPARFRFEPVVRFGLGLAEDEPSYRRLKLSAQVHKSLPSSLAVDFRGGFEAATGDTPLFELPSMGGADSVRGFRRDDALGRRLWNLQNELWFPLPVADGDVPGLRRFLREKTRLAGFVDLAGIYRTVDSESGLRVGTGLGLRFIFNPIVMKLDYGYGLHGEAATGGSRGKFYFGVETNLPF